MVRTGHTPHAGIQPVILGGDIGVYALARSFHEAYGVRSLVVGVSPIDAITHSRITEVVAVADPGDARAHVDALLRIAGEKTGPARLVLMANTDWFITAAVTHREELEAAGYIVPFLDQETLALVSDKARFAQICAEQGVPTPRTVVLDFGPDAAREPSVAQVADEGVRYPLVAKPSSSAAYNEVRFAGKQKVFHVADAAELERILGLLRGAGFSDRFLAQELIPGDDTQMRSITAYVDTEGTVGMLGSAHVLLEDHAPTMLGNPVAMITGRDDALTEPARRFLQATGYRGFANFDVKIDPRDGTAYFFEVNPRIGRNSYYMTAAGMNPMRWLVADHVDGRPEPARVLEREILYTLVPTRLLMRYVREPELAERVEGLIRDNRVVNPLNYGGDVGLRRKIAVTATTLNQYRKFARHYPQPTDSSF